MAFRIAACQMNSQADKAANLRAAARLIDEAADQGADLVALPEMFNVLGEPRDMLANAEPIGGPTTQFLQDKAREHGITVHGGSFPEVLNGEERCGNTTLVIDPSGEITATYRKIHLFDIDIGGQVKENESSRFAPGQEMVTTESDHGVLGLTICYDIRFPELYRALTLNGARVIFQPAAFTLYTGKDHWEALIRARAIENQVFMVAPAQFGSHPPGKYCFGNTMIVDPWGAVIARAPEREAVVVADIDYDYQDRVRRELPSLQHRRPEVYGSLQ